MSLYYLILWNQVDILQKHFKKDHVHMRLWTRFYGIFMFAINTLCQFFFFLLYLVFSVFHLYFVSIVILPNAELNSVGSNNLGLWRASFTIFPCITCDVNTVEPRYNEVLGTMKITLLYQVSYYIRVKKQRNIKSWDQQNYLVIREFCYIRPLYNEVPL